MHTLAILCAPEGIEKSVAFSSPIFILKLIALAIVLINRSMDRVDESVINYDLIEDTLSLICSEEDAFAPPEAVRTTHGAVLIFLPGLGEIRSLTERLQSSRVFGNPNQFEVIALHSALAPADQRRAFTNPRKGVRKIIVSTNLAETSVTIPDVTVGKYGPLLPDGRSSVFLTSLPLERQ